MKQVYRRYPNAVVFAMASIAMVYMVLIKGSKGTSWFDFSPSPFPWLSTSVDRKSDSAFTFNHISSHMVFYLFKFGNFISWFLFAAEFHYVANPFNQVLPI